MIEPEGIQDMANRLHANAVRFGVATVRGQKYELNFVNGNYNVTLNGKHVVTFNTRYIAEARKWLREYV